MPRSCSSGAEATRGGARARGEGDPAPRLRRPRRDRPAGAAGLQAGEGRGARGGAQGARDRSAIGAAVHAAAEGQVGDSGASAASARPACRASTRRRSRGRRARSSPTRTTTTRSARPAWPRSRTAARRARSPPIRSSSRRCRRSARRRARRRCASASRRFLQSTENDGAGRSPQRPFGGRSRRPHRRDPAAGRTRRAALAAMLAEQSPVFAGRGTNEAERLRGYILASFETVGLPPEAVPFVLEELETGRNPYTVAAAARALRGASRFRPRRPALLVGAIARLRGADDVVSFERFEPAPASGDAVTALAELARRSRCSARARSAALEDLRALVDATAKRSRRRPCRAREGGGSRRARPTCAAPACCGREIDAEAAHTAHRDRRTPVTGSRPRAGGPGRRAAQLLRGVRRPSDRARVLLHAVHEPREVLAHGDAARRGSRSA